MSGGVCVVVSKGSAESARNIAFYLPQFHEIPENNEWWGRGFTEWTNVRRARPLFAGHAQPVEPGYLGYYDLTEEQIRSDQAELAAAYGIDGFCYWNYWFGHGRKILERPLAAVLASGAPDFPFCLCWANQTWSGIWHGAPNRILIEQTYPGRDDIAAHFDYLMESFADRRYVRKDGRPVFLIYRPGDLPDPGFYLAELRRLAEAAGLPGLHLVGMSNDLSCPALSHFDQVMAFGPGDYLDEFAEAERQAVFPFNLLHRYALRPKVQRHLLSPLIRHLPGAVLNAGGFPSRFRYADVVDRAFSRLPASPRTIPCVLTGWDNTPRSGRRGVVFTGYTPELLAEYVRRARRFNNESGTNDFIFFKAWNEWAEGNTLEPTAADGLRYLEAVRTALGREAATTPAPIRAVLHPAA